jgi:pimeloyl-ACP methyl ester carboxylesterase
MPKVMANGIELAYEVRGEGEPVLLVAGTGQARATWDLFQVPALVAAGYKVFSYDNRGVAPSACPPEPYTVFEMAADAAAFIEALGIGPCRVAGLSLGAFITQELALARPDLVRGAVMMGTLGEKGESGRMLTASWVEFDRTGIKLPKMYDLVAQLPVLFSAHKIADEEFVKAFIEVSIDGPDWEDPGRIGQHMADDDYDNRLEALAGITVPTMVMAFELDMLTLARMGRAVAAAIPGCKLVEIPQVGHAGPLEAPDQVNAALIDFFAGV